MLHAERIVHEHVDEASGSRFYLVKWRKCLYDTCTWERAEDVSLNAISDYTFRSTARKLHARDNDNKRAGRKRKVRDGEEEEEEEEEKEECPGCVFGNGKFALQPHQEYGLRWLAMNCMSNRDCILADDMGVGKTAQTVALFHFLVHKKKAKDPAVVVAPSSILDVWLREIERFSDLYPVILDGKVASRQVALQYEWDSDYPGRSYKFDVLIVSYETLLSNQSLFKSMRFSCAVADEAHRVKNHLGQTRDALDSLKRDFTVLLTGTPIQNNTAELWSVMNLVQPRIFPSLEQFQKIAGDLSTKEQVAAITEMIRPFILRREKKDLQQKLPPKREVIVHVELTLTQKKFYKAIYERCFETVMGKEVRLTKSRLNNLSIQLRKVCCHPLLFPDFEQATDDRLRNLVEGSGKMILLDKLLPKLKRDNHRVLIFSQWRKVLDLVEEYLSYRKYKTCRVDGGVGQEKRHAIVDEFNRPDSDCFVFLLTTHAGGVGLTLTGADTVILFDSDWNLENDFQAQARAHRIGQTRPVMVYRLITSKSYESEMFDRSCKKLTMERKLIGGITESTSSSSSSSSSSEMKKRTYISDMNTDDMDQLARYGAYDVFKNESEQEKRSKAFCESDIDSILSHSTEVKYSSEQEATATTTSSSSASFSKVSFVTEDGKESVDLTDPDFWKKIGVTKTEKQSSGIDGVPLVDGKRARRSALPPPVMKKLTSAEEETKTKKTTTATAPSKTTSAPDLSAFFSASCLAEASHTTDPDYIPAPDEREEDGDDDEDDEEEIDGDEKGDRDAVAIGEKEDESRLKGPRKSRKRSPRQSPGDGTKRVYFRQLPEIMDEQELEVFKQKRREDVKIQLKVFMEANLAFDEKLEPSGGMERALASSLLSQQELDAAVRQTALLLNKATADIYTNEMFLLPDGTSCISIDRLAQNHAIWNALGVDYIVNTIKSCGGITECISSSLFCVSRKTGDGLVEACINANAATFRQMYDSFMQSMTGRKYLHDCATAAVLFTKRCQQGLATQRSILARMKGFDEHISTVVDREGQIQERINTRKVMRKLADEVEVRVAKMAHDDPMRQAASDSLVALKKDMKENDVMIQRMRNACSKAKRMMVLIAEDIKQERKTLYRILRTFLDVIYQVNRKALMCYIAYEMTSRISKSHPVSTEVVAPTSTHVV